MALLNGIDISSYQSGIEIDKIKADFVIVKASEGLNYEDPNFRQFARDTLRAKRKLGIYHFARPGKENTAEKEAAWFLELFRPYMGKAVPVLDWEAEEISNVSWAKKWLDKVYEDSGVRPWIYMSESVANAYDWSQVAKEYPLWMALYHTNATVYNYDMRDAGTLVQVKHWKRIVCWQWTSHGRLSGWNKDLDLDRFYGDGSLWESYERSEQTSSKKSNEAIADEVIEGKWGSGKERKQRLEAAGYDYSAIQRLVDEKLEEQSKYIYIVQQGDTLTSIAKRYGTSVAALIKLNQIADPDLLHVHERLRVR